MDMAIYLSPPLGQIICVAIACFFAFWGLSLFIHWLRQVRKRAP